MPPRLAPKAYKSWGASLRRRPGIRNERGTHVGASRTMPLLAASPCLMSAGLAVSRGAFSEVFFEAGGFLAMPDNSSIGDMQRPDLVSPAGTNAFLRDAGGGL